MQREAKGSLRRALLTLMLGSMLPEIEANATSMHLYL
jgi:hypothetical protein